MIMNKKAWIVPPLKGVQGGDCCWVKGNSKRKSFLIKIIWRLKDDDYDFYFMEHAMLPLEASSDFGQQGPRTNRLRVSGLGKHQ
jgi:hypothetical protein